MRTSFPAALLAASLAALIGTAGCFEEAKKQQAELQSEVVLVSGTVDWKPPVEGPLVMFVVDATDSSRVYDHLVIQNPREFTVNVPSEGSLRLWLVRDENRDFVCDPDEPAYDATPPQLMELLRSEDVEGIEVTVDGSLQATLPAPVDLQSRALDRTLQLYRTTLLNTGQVISLDEPRFDREWSKKGVSAPIEFLEEVGAGTYLLEPYDPEKTPVLFVHGAKGIPRDFRVLVDHLDERRFQAWVYHYPAGFGLDIIARYLNDTIEELQFKFGFSRLHVVAHSMGGLVSRRFIQTNASHGYLYIRKFVTISTPWRGHNAARMGVWFAPEAVPSWHDMVPESEFLAALLAEPLPEHVDYRLFFSFKGVSMFTEGADDGSVALSSQLDLRVQHEAGRMFGFNETHTSILENVEVANLVNDFLL